MEATTTIGNDTVLYLYGMVRPPVDLSGLIGVCAVSKVFLVEVEDVACAVSAVPALEYHLPPDARRPAEQLEWITPRAWRHHEVLRQLHAVTTVVPLKFGTLSADVEQVRSFLRRVRQPVADLLVSFRGTDEWTLKICADVEALSLAVQMTQPTLMALKGEERTLPEGRAYFARKKLQRATTDVVEATLDTAEQRIYERLAEAGLAVAVSPPPRRPDQSTSGPVANASVLVERDKFKDFEAILRQLEAEHANACITFELVGPWPPYSFVTTLNLDEEASSPSQ